MIQLKDLDMELTEVLDGKLESIVGGESFNQRGFIGFNGIIGQDLSATWKIKGTATSISGSTNGTLGFDTNLNPNFQVTGAGNLTNGNYQVNVVSKPTNNLSIGFGVTNSSTNFGIGYSY